MYQRYEWVLRKSGDVKDLRICDVGCGSGRFVTALAKKGAAHITGVDVAPEMLKIAQRVVAQDGTADRCDFVLSDVLDWRTDDKYDITIAIGFWDYIMSPPERLRLIRRFTTRKFLSAWPRYWTWRMPVRKARLALRGCPVYFFRKPQVYRMLEGAGFQVESCETLGKLFCVEARPV
jgi:predicted RNA methylase